MNDSFESVNPFSPLVGTALLESLSQKGWFASQELIPTSVVNGLWEQFQQHQKNAVFKKAGIGQGARQQVVSEVRGDHIHWIEHQTPSPQEAPFIAWLEAFKTYLNGNLFLGLSDQEFHYAAYPPGTGYQKHIDVFKESSQRTVSMVLYLNPSWKVGDGGELSIFAEDDPNHLEVQIQPVFSNCAVFLSGKIYHQVEFTNRERFSVTGWLKKPAPTAVLPGF